MIPKYVVTKPETKQGSVQNIFKGWRQLKKEKALKISTKVANFSLSFNGFGEYVLLANGRSHSINTITPYRKSASRGWTKFAPKDIFRGKYFATATVEWSQGSVSCFTVSDKRWEVIWMRGQINLLQDGTSSRGNNAHFLNSFKSRLIVQLVDITVPSCQHSSESKKNKKNLPIELSGKVTEKNTRHNFHNMTVKICKNFCPLTLMSLQSLMSDKTVTEVCNSKNETRLPFS